MLAVFIFTEPGSVVDAAKYDHRMRMHDAWKTTACVRPTGEESSAAVKPRVCCAAKNHGHSTCTRVVKFTKRTVATPNVKMNKPHGSLYTHHLNMAEYKVKE